MRQLLFAAGFAVFAACVPQTPAPPAPQPTTVETQQTTAQIVNAVARVLADADFEVTVADADAGLVTARRVGPRRRNAAWQHCEKNIGGEGTTPVTTSYFESTVTVSVTTEPNDGANRVRIAARVEGRGTGPLDGQYMDCVSSGAIESRIAAALRGP